MSNFDVVFDRVIGSEGGFQDKRSDRGNWTSGKVGVGKLKGTKFGLSAMTYPTLDIKNLTLREAKAIYYEDWWLKLGIDRFCNQMKFQMFDAAFNHGMRNASKMYQRAVGAKPDGFIGLNTLKAASLITDENDRTYRFIAERIKFFTKCSTWDDNGRGWMDRMADNLNFASEDN